MVEQRSSKLGILGAIALSKVRETLLSVVGRDQGVMNARQVVTTEGLTVSIARRLTNRLDSDIWRK